MRACLVGERGILFSGEPSGSWYETRGHAWNCPLWGELSYCLSGDGFSQPLLTLQHPKFAEAIYQGIKGSIQKHILDPGIPHSAV